MGHSEDKRLALVVDDEPLVRRTLARSLGRLGFEVACAEDGASALTQLAQGAAPSVVVLDRHMPGMSGEELLAEVRKRWPRLPVVLVSGYATAENGADPCTAPLGKPFREAELLGAIERVTRAAQ